MRVINAGIGRKLIGRQFTTLPGTVERMLQDGSFANQIVEGTQGFLGCHTFLMLRRPFPERKCKKCVSFSRCLLPSTPICQADGNAMGSGTKEKPNRATNNSASRITRKGMITSRANQMGYLQKHRHDSRFQNGINRTMTRIWTVGHSTRTIEKFIEALRAHGIKLVADVRLLPGSKRYPQFNRERLAKYLTDHAIAYEHFPELGGRRKPRTDSRNTAWRNEAFRGYADYMETAEFPRGIA